MGFKTGIDYVDHTWNPWIGCHKVSAGCANCYMFRELLSGRFGKRDPEDIHRTMPNTFYAPLRWDIKARQRGVIETVFVCSWGDFFLQEAWHWQTEAFEIMRRCHNLRFLLVTKRVERIAEVLREELPGDWSDKDWDNLWLIPTAENQEMADKRIPVALSSPFKHRGVSIEPMLGMIEPIIYEPEINFSWIIGLDGGDWKIPAIDWVIIGAESGPNRRDCDIGWVKMMVSLCRAAEVPVFVKQMNINGRLSKDMNEWPRDLRVREMPW